mmetsp:Transcript_100102/g.291953  ORF Transcript_100102/g.291953 Transcript_100102/m.291953 type:complete len:242 (-) Transcript_100102:425-1150(-)
MPLYMKSCRRFDHPYVLEPSLNLNLFATGPPGLQPHFQPHEHIPVQSCSLCDALHETRRELLPVQVLSDEDHFAAPLLSRLPGSFLGVSKEHVNCLEDEFLLHALHSKDSFGAEQVSPLLLQKPRNPIIQLLLHYLTWNVNSNGRHSSIVLMIMAILQESIIHFDDLVQGEATDAQDEVHLHLTVGRTFDGYRLIDGTDSLLHFRELLFRIHKIALVQQDPVCEGNLFHSLVFNTFRLLVL